MALWSPSRRASGPMQPEEMKLDKLYVRYDLRGHGLRQRC